MNLQLTKVRRSYARPAVADVAGEVAAQVGEVARDASIQGSIAIAVGSRGIANIVDIVRTVVSELRARGASPFVIPAMGSHGGGTAEGQAEILAGYGITAQSVGCPIRSSMETVELTPDGGHNRVFMDRLAYASDGVVLINRVKLHTDFHGPHESGLVKMSVIGLGKHRQALEIHSAGVHGLRHHIPWTAQQIFASGKVLFGIALVENAYDETMVVRALRADEILAQEPALLDISRANMPSLPVDDIDVLIIDRMGKDISGSGIDPNIIGRNLIRDEPEPERPRVKAMTVHDLTPASHGNAVGMGFADVTTRRLFNRLDLQATNENTVTSSFLQRGKIPVVAPDDETAYAWALRSCNLAAGTPPRVVRILDTLHLIDLHVSDSVLSDLRDRDDITILSEAEPTFTATGDLSPF